MSTFDTVIADTSKGKRVWIQGVFARTGRTTGQRFNVVFVGDTIQLVFDKQGKRKVTDSKGGIIDTVGKKVTQWAQGADTATVHVTPARIVISRKA